MMGTGVSRNDDEALKYIRASADRGYAPAQTSMGYFYENGELVLSDPQLGIAWYKKAAAQNDKISLLSLGRMYYTGYKVTRDIDEAAKWLQRSADQGEPISQLYLGLIREEKDYSPGTAASWYRKSAEQGVTQAQQKLANVLDQGRGVPRDAVGSYMWYLIAFESGSAAASPQVNRLESDIGSTAALEAKQKALSLKKDIDSRKYALGCFDWPTRNQEFPAPPPPRYQQNCKR
jgi:TPR repeat protein